MSSASIPLKQNFYHRASEHLLFKMRHMNYLVDWESMSLLSQLSPERRQQVEKHLRNTPIGKNAQNIMIFPLKGVRPPYKLNDLDEDSQPSFLLHGCQESAVLSALSAGGVMLRGPAGKKIRKTERFGVFAANNWDTALEYCTLCDRYLWLVLLHVQRYVHYGGSNYIMKEHWCEMNSIILADSSVGRPGGGLWANVLVPKPVLYRMPLPHLPEFESWGAIVVNDNLSRFQIANDTLVIYRRPTNPGKSGDKRKKEIEKDTPRNQRRRDASTTPSCDPDLIFL